MVQCVNAGKADTCLHCPHAKPHEPRPLEWVQVAGKTIINRYCTSWGNCGLPERPRVRCVEIDHG